MRADQIETRSAGETPSRPLLGEWTPPFRLPPFDRIASDDFRPAFDQAVAEHAAEVAAIAQDPAAPTFANTIDAFERAGRSLDQVASVFYNLTGAHTSDALQAVEREIAPVLARHSSAIYLNESLFRRIDALFEKRDSLDLTPEQARVLERLHTRFVRSGARLAPAAKERLAAITERLATLGTRFSQNLLADERDYALVLESEEDLAGLPTFLRAAAACAAAQRGHEGKHVITLTRSLIEPFLQFSGRRDLREQAFAAWISRGDKGGETDNKAIIAETIALRAERARLMGSPSFADFRLSDAMAKTPEAARDLLDQVWTPARA